MKEALQQHQKVSEENSESIRQQQAQQQQQ